MSNIWAIEWYHINLNAFLMCICTNFYAKQEAHDVT